VIIEHHLVDVFIGVDVGRSNHHAVALDRYGKILLDKALPQDEAKLREIIVSLARQGALLLVVDQRTRSVPCRSPWTRPKASWSVICPGWTCAASRTCTRASPGPTPGTRPSSPRQPRPCPQPARHGRGL
jgi:hypothetical protein